MEPAKPVPPDRSWARHKADRVRARLALVRVPSKAIVYRQLGQPGRGRLGNQLWQIAGTLGIAARLGRPARFPAWSYRRHFSIPDHHFRGGLLPGTDATGFARHIRERHRPYLQDAGLWREIQPTIREYFAPSQSTRAELNSKFADFLAVPDKTALHVRRGDYLAAKNRLRFPILSERYLRAAQEMVSGTNIVVFSDDIAWCRANLAWANPVMFMSGNSDYEDLLLMARCDRHILANSSFSWWGAFLSGDPSPIFPERWYGPMMSNVDPTLMFPDGWVGIDV